MLGIKFFDFISRINFQELDIKAYFELKEDPENPLSQWELAVDPLGANPGVIYDLFLPQFSAGKNFIFRARLKNDYGYSWWSNTTTFIEIPSPQPSIQNVELTNEKNSLKNNFFKFVILIFFSKLFLCNFLYNFFCFAILRL